MLTVKFNIVSLWEVKDRTDVLIVVASLNTMAHLRHVIVLLELIFAVLDVRESGKTTAKKQSSALIFIKCIFFMNTTDFTYKLVGKYVHIEKCDFPLIDLNKYFTTNDLNFIFGENFDEDNYLIGIEKSKWYTHLIFRLNASSKIVGYLELIKVKDEVELHGGGTNNSFIEKLARTEAWYLIIKYCFDEYKINWIFTSCRIDNVKAYNLITGTGFKEIGKNEKGDCFKFKLSYGDFLSNRIFKMLSLNTKIILP